MPLRACNVDGCDVAAVAAAFLYANGNGARVVNASIGSPNFSQTLQDVITVSPDTLFVAAAGNEGLNLDAPGVDHFPCEVPRANVICVGATDPRDALPTFSNYGAVAVDLAAPASASSVRSSAPTPSSAKTSKATSAPLGPPAARTTRGRARASARGTAASA